MRRHPVLALEGTESQEGQPSRSRASRLEGAPAAPEGRDSCTGCVHKVCAGSEKALEDEGFMWGGREA